MEYPVIDESKRMSRLAAPEGLVSMVLDTDTFNEVDDQFAVVQALLSPENLSVEAIYAAPFFNNRSSDPGDGMLKSYEEILRLLERLDVRPEGLVFKGSESYLPGKEVAVDSGAARDLIKKAMSRGVDDEPLYVVAIGAITNVASAILLEPGIIERIVVVWLGGQPLHWENAKEFNLGQDIAASRVVLDCGVPLVLLPCQGVTSHLLTTVPEIDKWVDGQGDIGCFLADTFRGYSDDHFAWAKVIWDIAGPAWLLDGNWVKTELVASPVLTDECTWQEDRSRHLIRIAVGINRNAVFGDLFGKIRARAANLD